MTIDINGHSFRLLHEKALYKASEGLLIIADVHLGKANHFRREGIAIPAQAQQADYKNLELLLLKIQPQKVYFLGDLFHSSFNRSWEPFCDLIRQFPSVAFTLVKGNHDIIDVRRFDEVCITVTDAVEDDAFAYTHAPLQNVPPGKVNIYGHIHPGIVLTGMGRQHIKLPCFYLTQAHLIVPAFGVLTGLYSMERLAGAKVYAVLPDSVVQVS